MNCHAQQKRNHVDSNYIKQSVTTYQNNSAVAVGADSFINLYLTAPSVQQMVNLKMFILSTCAATVTKTYSQFHVTTSFNTIVFRLLQDSYMLQ